MDEFLLLGVPIAVGLWIYWYYAFLRVFSFRPDKVLTVPVGLTPPACLGLVLVVLLRWSSSDVRADREAILFYMILGALWLRLGLFLLSLTGVSVREDVLERQNRAAAWAICGAMAGLTFCFAGSNIRQRPGPEVVLFCAALSTAAFFAVWLCFEQMARLGDRITIERDQGVGIRIGAWCAGAGLILGSAVAGDWKSTAGKLRDFVQFGWGAIPLLLVGILVERYASSRSKAGDAGLKASLATGAAYLLASGAYVLWLNTR